MTSRRRGPREPTPGPAAPDPVVQLPAPAAAELVAQVFSYPQLRAFVAHNPPGSANERVALDAIHLLIDNPELYRGGSQVEAIAARMSPLDIVADRRVIPPGPLADTLTAALARQQDPDNTPDVPPRPAAEQAITALRPDITLPDTIRPEPPAELEPEYVESLIAETEARIAAGETDLIGEIDPADEAAAHRGDDLEDYYLEDYYGVDDDYDLDPAGRAGFDPDDVPDRDRTDELDFGAAEERARSSLAKAREELADWDRRRETTSERLTHDAEPPAASISRLDHVAREAARARRDVAEREADRHAGGERHPDLAAEREIDAPPA